MFDRVGDLAQRVATSVSRRAFLGRLGQGALGLAAAIGGVLAVPGEAHAAGQWCVFYAYGYGGCWYYTPVKGTCPCGGYLVNYKPACRKSGC
jgi:hypothetical protein